MNANGRRQRQAKMGYTHLSMQRRPLYRKRSLETSAQREAKATVTRERMRQGKKK